MTLKTIKTILLPLGIMFTLGPIYLALVVYLAENFGPWSIFYLMFVLGVISLITFAVISVILKRREKVTQSE